MRRSFLTSALALAVLGVAPGSAGLAAPPGSPSFRDSAVGNGSTSTFTFAFNVASGPSGENPTGFTTTDGFGAHFEGSSITCLFVNGNTATFAGSLKPNLFGFTNFKVTAVDNGPANSGLDTYAANGYFAPVDCSAPEGAFLGPLTSGDVVVVDSPSAPTSKVQCKNGGYNHYGFKNQGQCVAFVERGPKG